MTGGNRTLARRGGDDRRLELFGDLACGLSGLQRTATQQNERRLRGIEPGDGLRDVARRRRRQARKPPRLPALARRLFQEIERNFEIGRARPLAGELRAPRKPGNTKYKPIEPAPGRYVKERAS